MKFIWPKEKGCSSCYYVYEKLILIFEQEEKKMKRDKIIFLSASKLILFYEFV